MEVIEHAICKANEELIKKAAGDEAMSGMGTTVVVVTVIGKRHGLPMLVTAECMLSAKRSNR